MNYVNRPFTCTHTHTHTHTGEIHTYRRYTHTHTKRRQLTQKVVHHHQPWLSRSTQEALQMSRCSTSPHHPEKKKKKKKEDVIHGHCRNGNNNKWISNAPNPSGIHLWGSKHPYDSGHVSLLHLNVHSYQTLHILQSCAVVRARMQEHKAHTHTNTGLPNNKEAGVHSRKMCTYSIQQQTVFTMIK